MSEWEGETMQLYQDCSFNYENGISKLAFRPSTGKVLIYVSIKDVSSSFHVMF